MRIFATLKFNLIFLLAVVFQVQESVFAAWNFSNSGVANDLSSIFFTDPNNGWVAGNGIILNTNNGGSTWTTQFATSTALKDIQFINASTGIAVGAGGVIVKTTNGGATWTAVNSGTAFNLLSISWGDNLTVYASGQLGQIVKSSDGGNTWSNGAPSGSGTANDLRGIFFVNNSTGWATGPGSTLIQTNNGGTNWTSPAVSGFTNVTGNGIFFLNISTGLVSGGGGLVHQTVNGGVAWNTVFSSNVQLNSVHFARGTLTGRVVGNSGIILVSMDGGNTFQLEASTTTNNLAKVFNLISGIAFACGSGGTIIINSSAAVSSVVLSTSTPPSQGSLKPIHNLFNPANNETTTIQYGTLNTGQVTVTIYTIQGRIVKTLVNQVLSPGNYSIPWNGTNDNGETVASGIYLVHIEAPQFSQTQKIAVVQ